MSKESKKEILNQKIDDNQLDSVTGGIEKSAGCDRNYYKGECVATVEDGSSCWFTNDKCVMIQIHYCSYDGVTTHKHED